MGRLGHAKSVSLSHVFQGLETRDLKLGPLESPSRMSRNVTPVTSRDVIIN